MRASSPTMRFVVLGISMLVGACALGPQYGGFPEDAQRLTGRLSNWSQPAGDASANAVEAIYLDQLIADKQLGVLIREAFAANPGLQQILLTLRMRQMGKQRVGGERLPSVQVSLDASSAEDTDAVHTNAVAISWQLDLWQKIGDETKAAGFDVAEQRALHQSARDTLATEIMKTWLGLINSRHNIDVQQRRLQSLERNERFIVQRYRNGLGDASDLSSARSSLSSARATLAGYEESLHQQQRALQTLLGREAHGDIDIAADYPHVNLPLAGLPEQTLQRRPDLQAAYHAIEAASSRGKAAYKELLPSISIQAALTDTAQTPRDMLFNNPLWSLLGQLTAPLYQGGQLRAAAAIADLEIAYAYQDYRDTLLTAVSEVEDALGLELALARQQGHIESALASARASLGYYQRSYRSGLVSIIDLLTVERASYDLEAELDDLVFQRLSNRVDLGLALGLGVSG